MPNLTANDNLPPVSKLRQIVALLGADTSRLPLTGMTPDRQRTALGAVASALLAAKLTNHTLAVDPLTPEERYMLNISAATEATDGAAASGLALAAYLMDWAGNLVSEATRSDDGTHSPGPAIEHLVAAAGELLGPYIDAQDAPGFELDGTVYHVTEGGGLHEALEHMAAAAAMVQRMIAPRES